MRPSRTLLPLLSSLILCMVVWTSDVHALSVLVENLNSSGAVITGQTHTINFTSSASVLPGCVSGQVCNTVTGWNATNQTYTLNPSWLTLTRANTGYTSGPIASRLDNGTSASFGLNGMVFQGLSATTGQLRITMHHNFTALTTNTRSWGFMENGSFLQPGGNVATPTVDTLTMQGKVDSTFFPATAISQNGSLGGTTRSYNFSSPTTSVGTTKEDGGTDLRYIWVYNYDNTGQTLTSKFSDPPGGIGNCDEPSQNPGCQSVIGGVGVYGIIPGDPDGVLLLQNLSNGTGVPLPEPSSVLLLGLGLLSGGIFFASRLRKGRETR